MPRSKGMGKSVVHQMSMQDLATEANVGIGLISKYFGGREDLLLATILRIQDAFRDQLAPVMEAAGVRLQTRCVLNSLMPKS
jgi:AcrR family transcriptional regulator